MAGKKQKKTDTKEIIVTRIFPNSEYLQEGNIGHEIINLFKSDNFKSDNFKSDKGENYIYLMPSGYYAESHKNNNIEAILLVRAINSECVEVIAKATGIEKIFVPEKGWKGTTVNEVREMGRLIEEGNENKNEKIKAFKEAHKKQLDYIKNNDIRYGGVLLNELFKNNTTDKYGLSLYVTYKADKVVKAKKPFYLYVGDNSKTENDRKLQRNRLAGSALTTFYKYGDKDYTSLDGIIRDSKLWGNEISEYDPNESFDDDFTFLSLIRKEYDELSFSNIFAHYFDKYPRLLEHFLNKIGVVNIDFKSSPEITREEKHIDILIKAEKPIIIENKIKSGINGKKHDIYGKLVGTQLDDYYNYVEKEYGKEPVCLIFSPDYNNIDTSKIQGEHGKKYKVITYSKIHEIVNEFYDQNKSLFKGDVYFADFLKAIKYHAAKNDNRFEALSKKKLKALIDKANSQP